MATKFCMNPEQSGSAGIKCVDQICLGYVIKLIMPIGALVKIRIWTACWRNSNQIVWFEMYKILIFSTKNRIKKKKTFLTKHWRHLQDVSMTGSIV